MKYIFRTIEFSLFLSAFLAWIAAALSVGSVLLLPSTVENGKSINNAFMVASSHIEKFLQENNRLPTSAELELMSGNDRATSRHWMVEIDPLQKVGEGVYEGLKISSSDRYTLSIWRGEWHEYFVPSSKESTVDSSSGLYLSCFGMSIFFGVLGTFLFKARRMIRDRYL